MDHENNKIKYLLEAWKNQTISVDEKEELVKWVKESKDWSEFYQYVDSLVEQYDSIELDQQIDWENLFDKIQTTKKETTVEKSSAKVIDVHFTKRKSVFMRPRFKWAVAAILVPIISVFSISLFWSLYNSNTSNLQSQYTDVKAPDRNKAYVTFGDGRTIYLDSLQNGLLADVKEAPFKKVSEEKITYQSVSSDNTDNVSHSNTLTNPKGSKVIDLVLSDGSQVWLNSGSSITFPVTFKGNNRKVSVVGEAYFEVAHDDSKPFYVSKGDMNVRVLGTHFNVKAYNDDSDIRVTLLEGSVEVNNANQHVLIKPGQQAIIENESAIKLAHNIDVDQVMAWKNGVFKFDNSPIESALKELGRWYNVEIIYEGKVPEIELWGEIKRDLTLSQVLRGLGRIGVNYRVENNKIFITPEKK
ncbi:FecR family protein [Formosa sp. S-31]|uniref:FecR family protein n=1 Tax=Formosa sp. S-31 TaxID=2790949 RepID=UPI003EBB47F7